MAASASGRLRLSREQRLRHRHEFAEARERGRRMTRRGMIANVLVGTDLRWPRLGVVTSRKVGSAVVRSRARRLLREAFRLSQPRLVRPAIVVLVARPAIAGCGLREVERDLHGILREAGLVAAAS